MPHILIQVSYSGSAVKALTDNPQDRTEVVRKSIESAGGKLHSFFFAFGKYDAVVVAEMPSNEAAAALGLAIAGTGALTRYETTVLMTPQEGVEAMRKAKSIAYSPPR
jgi:uncharacterized protein with GYD domain